MADPRVRRDVWKLSRWDPILLWYARAIAEMKRRSLNDPTSWRYQAAIHDYVRQGDPLATSSDTLPSSSDQQRFWRQCQHNTWFFLPWHRMYLGFFEQIVAATVAQLGGPADWALPYWNYSDSTNANARRIPPAFREAQTPDGVANPLRVSQRNPGVNTGGIVADDDEVDIVVCLSEPSFVAAPAGGSPGFGGPKTLFNHSGGAVGFVERTPHGDVHVAVGGWMGRFNTAGLDPLFWLHHANIDRLWTVWRQRNPLHLDPTNPQWLTSVPFEFHDDAGAIVSMTPDQVVDTTQAPLGYQYEDVSDPLGGDSRAPRPGRGPEMEEEEERPIPEMVGATDRPVVLKGKPESTSLSVSAPAGPGRSSRSGAVETPKKVYLNIENITGAGEPTSYAVYLNLPAGADPEQHRELFAGILPMFGVAEASRTDQNHAGSGLQYSLEVGAVVRALEARNDWDPADVRITFVPRRRSLGSETSRSAEEPDPIQVGRVSVYFA
jgi:tyrosinase